MNPAGSTQGPTITTGLARSTVLMDYTRGTNVRIIGAFLQGLFLHQV